MVGLDFLLRCLAFLLNFSLVSGVIGAISEPGFELGETLVSELAWMCWAGGIDEASPEGLFASVWGRKGIVRVESPFATAVSRRNLYGGVGRSGLKGDGHARVRREPAGV